MKKCIKNKNKNYHQKRKDIDTKYSFKEPKLKTSKINEAIQNSSYIISSLDSYHDKSYLRIMMWMIEINELETAEEIKKEIENKFQGEKLKIFKHDFGICYLYRNKTNNMTLNEKVNIENNSNIEFYDEIHKKQE